MFLLSRSATGGHLHPMSHSFREASVRRRLSVVYADGKGGLFLPSDFLRAPPIDGEETALLPKRRQSLVRREIVEQERALLEDNQLLPGLPGASAPGGVAGASLGADRSVDGAGGSADGGAAGSAADADAAAIDAAFEAAAAAKRLSTTAAIELKTLIRSSIPLVLTFLLQNSLSTVSVFTVGHLGATELAAVSMGAMTANITGYATIQGIATALDTLCPQAFGAQKHHLVGVYMQKCIALIATIMAPILVVWVLFGEQLIGLVVPDRATARLAAVYLHYIAPGIPGYILFECGKRFLQAQGVYHVSTYVLLCAAPSNAVMNVVLVRHLGYYGAPIAVSINYWLMAAGLFGATLWVKPADTPAGIHPLRCWGGLNVRQAFLAWDRLAYLAVPGLVMLEAEFLAFEILTLLALYLGTVLLAAQLIGTTMASLTYQVPFAIGIALLTRIANFLGADMGASAHKATQVALLFGLVISALNFLVLYGFQTEIARMFTNDARVIAKVEDVMWLIALMQISDAVNANLAGCLRGQGQTKIGGIVNLVLYYVVGLPLLVYLSFHNHRYRGTLDGLWIGSTVALTIIGVVQSYYALFADFGRLCDDARKRTEEPLP